MVKDFLLQFSFMCGGAAITILWRAIQLIPADEFSFRKFFLDRKNYQRFLLLAALFAVAQYLLVFEGTAIVDGMKSVGFIVPVAASSVIGLVLTWAAFKVKDAKV